MSDRISRSSPPTRREFLGLVPGALAAANAIAGVPAVREYRRGGMVYRQLGRTGLDVSLLSFGSHTDTADKIKAGPGQTVLTEQGQARRDRIIARAFDLGVNLLDVYATEGQWEPAARMVKGRRDKILISLAHNTTPKDIDDACRLFGHVDLYRFHTAEIDGPTLESWDIMRRAKEAGKIRAIGIATHIERTMTMALDELEGIDYLFFPYNFIHARADYSQFLPAAIRQGVGLIAMKPLAQGSIVHLDPRSPRGASPESDRIQLWQRGNKPIIPAVVAELTKSLDRLPDETLCMAALRFVFAKSFISAAIPGLFDMQWLEEDYRALARYHDMLPEEKAALGAARHLADLCGSGWLPPHYRWLEEQWRA